MYKLNLERERTERKEEMGRFENGIRSFHADILALIEKHLEHDEPVTQLQQPKEVSVALAKNMPIFIWTTSYITP